jgi:Animal haem peroxidase
MPDPPGATTPTQPPPHGTVARGLLTTPSSSTETGRFGRMFRRLPVYELSTQSLVSLGDAMIQPLENGKLDKPLGEEDDDENTSELENGELRLPAGYTYFGQFVDHDVTFDPVSSLSRQNDPNALVDFRTPRFDLDSVYGRGPADQPYLYEQDGLRLALGDPVSEDAAVAGPDLPRNASGRALIGDPRNDENLIISQLQVAFLEFHNAVLARIAAETGLKGTDLFKQTQQRVRWHYQWVVVHDFLPRLVGRQVVEDLLRRERYSVPGGEVETIRPRRLFFQWREQPFMPVEFSAAAYRFGHSTARPSYLINDKIPVPRVPDAARIPLFSDDPGELTNLNGFRRLPQAAGVQWKYFLHGVNDDPGQHDQLLPQPTYQLDTELGYPLGKLPDSVASAEPLFAGIPAEKAKSLAVRNLLRGQALGLPGGQDVAHAMGIVPLSEEELYDGLNVTKAALSDLRERSPLWFYVLREAQQRHGGEHLGSVGGRIVAEVLVGLLAGDPLSYLSVRPTWTPTLPGRTEGTFTLTDIVNLPGLA